MAFVVGVVIDNKRAMDRTRNKVGKPFIIPCANHEGHGIMNGFPTRASDGWGMQ